MVHAGGNETTVNLRAAKLTGLSSFQKHRKDLIGTPVVQILQVKYVEGLRSFQRESIFCSKISSGGPYLSKN